MYLDICVILEVENSLARKKQIISLDIGSSYIKAVAGWAKESGIDVISSAVKTIPKGCYSNGVVKDSRSFEDSLRDVIKQLGVRTKNVVISYESNEIIKRQFVIPKVGKEDIEDVLAYEITNYLPIDIDSYILQHKVLEELEDNRQKVYVAAVPFSLASALFDVIKSIGYNPLAMDLHTNGIESIVENKEKTVAVVDMGYEHINISIFEHGRYVFNRIISSGLNALDVGLSLFSGFDVSSEENPDSLEGGSNRQSSEIAEESVGNENENPTILKSEEKLQELRKNVKVASIWNQYYYGNLKSEEMGDIDRRALEEVVSAMDAILEEVEKVVQFQLKRSDSGGKIERVIIYGGGSLQAEMCEAIQKKLQIETVGFELPSTVKMSTSDNPLMLINAISAVDYSMNFFKPFMKEKTKTDGFKLFIVAIVLLMVAGVGWFTVSMLLEEKELRSQIEALETDITSFETVKALTNIKEKESLLSTLEVQAQFLEQANLEYERENSINSELLELINKQIPDKVFLTNISIFGSSITLEGIGYDHQNIAQFVHNLRSTERFVEFKMGSVDNDEEGYLFSVVLELHDVLSEEESNETR